MIRVYFSETIMYQADIPSDVLRSLPSGSFRPGVPQQDVAEELRDLAEEVDSGGIEITSCVQIGRPDNS